MPLSGKHSLVHSTFVLFQLLDIGFDITPPQHHRLLGEVTTVQVNQLSLRMNRE